MRSKSGDQTIPQHYETVAEITGNRRRQHWETVGEVTGPWAVHHPTRPQDVDSKLLPAKAVPEDRHDSVLEDGQLSYSAIMAIGHRGNTGNSPHHMRPLGERPSFHPPYPQEQSGEDDEKEVDDTPDEEIDQLEDAVEAMGN